MNIKHNIEGYEIIQSQSESSSPIKGAGGIKKSESKENKIGETECKCYSNSSLSYCQDNIPDLRTRSMSKSKSATKTQSLLEYLFSFLDSDEELNPVLCGYFGKVVRALFDRNKAKVI